MRKTILGVRETRSENKYLKLMHSFHLQASLWNTYLCLRLYRGNSQLYDRKEHDLATISYFHFVTGFFAVSVVNDHRSE